MRKTTLFLDSSFGKNALLIMISFCYAAVFALFFLKQPEYLYPQAWLYQFLFILALSYFSSLTLFIFSFKGNTVFIVFIFQLICKYLLTKPFSTYIWFEFFIIIIFLLEGVLILSVTETFILTAVILVSSMLTSHNDVFWSSVDTPRSWDLQITLTLLTVLVSGFCIIIKSGYLLLRRQKNIISDQNEIIKKLSHANAGFQQYANLAEEKSINSERMRMTREIHDTVGYTMTNLLMMLEASTDLVGVDPVKLEKLLNQALDIIKNGHKEMRHSLRVLRNTKVRETNSIESINSLVKVFKDSTGVDVKVEFGNLPWELNSIIDNIIYRFLQEGMTNSLTHGDAKKIDIHFRVNNDTIFINLIDDGNGCQDIKHGIGLKGMEERLSEVSGRLYYQNIHNGFSVKVEIPWKENG